MRRETFELVEEMIQQADAAHQESAVALQYERDSLEAVSHALIAIDWRIRAFMLAWIERERPIQVPEKEATT